jgi:hypothetical protein
MHYTVAIKNRFRYVIIGALLCVFLQAALVAGPVAKAVDTSVYAIICGSGSTITMTQPVSDSTTSQSVVPLAGTVDQANQIEVYVDDVFDSVIPLTVGQTNFNSQVTVSPGTHTIKLVAIDACQSATNGEASAVITYTPPPVDSGPGDQVDTVIPGENGVIIGENPVGQKEELPLLSFVPAEVTKAFSDIGSWLNIVTTYQGPADDKLTILRATTIVTGSWLLAFGIATTVIQWIGNSIPAFAKIPKTKRTRIISWVIRIIGLLLLIAGLFL